MKPIWKSKTFWANLLSAVIGGLEVSGLVDVIPAEWQPLLVLGMAALNIALRMVTTEPVRVR